jgi:thioredoxin 1
MKRNSFLIVLIAIVFMFTNCQGQSGVEKLTNDNFEKKLNATEKKILLDVRTPDEYKRGHLTNAILVNYYDNDFKNQVAQLDKNKPVFVYCATGIRSASAAKVLAGLGFKEIYDMQGGYNAWAGAKKPVEK